MFPSAFDSEDLVAALIEANDQGLDVYECALFAATMAIERWEEFAQFVEEQRCAEPKE